MKTYISFGDGHNHKVLGRCFNYYTMAVIEHVTEGFGREMAHKYFGVEFCSDYSEIPNNSYFKYDIVHLVKQEIYNNDALPLPINLLIEKDDYDKVNGYHVIALDYGEDEYGSTELTAKKELILSMIEAWEMLNQMDEGMMGGVLFEQKKNLSKLFTGRRQAVF